MVVWYYFCSFGFRVFFFFLLMAYNANAGIKCSLLVCTDWFRKEKATLYYTEYNVQRWWEKVCKINTKNFSANDTRGWETKGGKIFSLFFFPLCSLKRSDFTQ